ncbi:hypothetical protein HRD49_19035 [Corallococcus exiguus]|uniref:Uncharacterized protein n=1 Tax=Corallococcus exiguus TaxID=83462 RepID=A0A7X5BWC3_9BACT|nr:MULTISPECIES: hypothetical protein [Corallococcus]NBC44098.1 hypothetical protein [Corallococcus exiguus]NRD63848.1 hypothetical protein [Corallococcus exiguus]TNV62214.1 hypothetical protein FH620_18820 [Corallococcus exiguus]
MKLNRSSSVLSTKSDSALSTPQPRRSNSVDAKPTTTTSPSSTPTKPARSNSAPPTANRPPSDVSTGSPSRTRPRNPEGAASVNNAQASGAKKPTTNTEIRAWYKQQIAGIPANDAKLQAQGASLADRAKAAHAIRHEARVGAREFMGTFESAMLKARDFFKYGRLDGPSFDQLVGEAKKSGLSEAQAYDKIINSSQRTNQAVDNIYAKPQAKL